MRDRSLRPRGSFPEGPEKASHASTARREGREGLGGGDILLFRIL